MPGDGRPFTLRKGSLAVEIDQLPGAAETGEDELAAILVRETKADRRIVVTLGRFSGAARKLGEERRAQLWDRPRLEEEAGRMLLAEVDTRPAPAADESLLEPFLRESVAELGAEAVATPEAVAPGGTLPGPELFDGEGMLEPRVAQDKAVALVSERLEGAFRFDLRMVPHYCYSYACPVRRGHGEPEVRRGFLLVNGISGEVSAWEPSALKRWDGITARLEPSVEEPRSAALARDWLVEANTRVVHLKHDRGTVTVYEKVTHRPAPEAILLECRGIVFWPVWGVEGGNGALVLDALEGRVLKEELFSQAAKAAGPAQAGNGGQPR